MAVLTCAESYWYLDAAGNQAVMQEGDTVNDDHPAVRGHEAKFRPFTVTHQTVAPPQVVPPVRRGRQ